MDEELKDVPTKTVGKMKETLKHLVEKYAMNDGEPLSIFLWGGPGIGKSAIVRQIVEELDMDLERCFKDQRLQQVDPVDLRGLPFPNDEGRLEFHPPSFLPSGGRGVLFLDELNLAPQQVQAAAYELVLDRKLGDDYRLPDDWVVIAAGNRAGDRAFVNPMAAPLANRFVHWEVVPNLENWKEWAYEEGIRSEVIGFLNFKSEMLYKFDPERNAEAFPTPRTWEKVSKLMDDGLTGERELGAAVGVGAAAEFKAFLEVQEDLPNIERMLEGEMEFEVPREPDCLHATISSMVDKVRGLPELTGRLMDYANAIPNDLVEFSVVLVKDALRADIPVQKTDGYSQFVDDKGEFII